MKLVIDLQGAQGASRLRGIGRLSKELALAMARSPGRHEPVILLNEAFPQTAESFADTFARILPRDNIRSWRGLTNCSYVFGSLQRRRASEVVRAQVLAGMGADLVHVASVVEGVTDDVTSAWPQEFERIATVATFYDAIPLLWRSEYLVDPSLSKWYFRHLHELRQSVAVLAISESSRREAIDHLGFDPACAFNIRAGFDPAFFRPAVLDAAERTALLARHGLRDGFVLFVGAGDLRKNDFGLVEAYSRLPDAVCAMHQLVITGSWNPEGLRERATALGVRDHNLVLLTHIPEADLPSLYAICHGFVMPSKHEGFGLPALEAMACGAPVIASNTTSLPEVVGLAEALFDPNEPLDFAERLQRLVIDDGFRRQLVEHGLEQARKFSWSASAKLAWDALEQVHERHPAPVRAPARRPRGLVRKPSLAFVSPLPPDASGIADYARDLLPSLGRHYDVTLVSSSGTTNDPTLTSVFPMLSEAEFVLSAPRFDRIVYQAGNSEFHIQIVNNLLPRFPGVVVLHDAFVSNVPLNVFLRSGDRDAFARALFESHGWPAVKMLADRGEWVAAARCPCAAPIFRDALGVVFHSRHARAIAAQHMGSAAEEMVRVVPFARASWITPDGGAARAQLCVPADVALTCTFGIVASTKRPFDVLDAWHAAFGDTPPARLTFVGQVPSDLHGEIRARAEVLGAADRVILTGRVDEDVYRLWLAAADIAVQLRTESRGETSAAIADCMAAGLPVVANAHGAVAELPPDALALAPDQASTAEIGSILAELWSDPARRASLSASAAAYVGTELSPAAVARAHHVAIEDFYASPRTACSGAALTALPEADLPDAAKALAVSFGQTAAPRLLLDVSTMAQNDGGTGIQRVIREITTRLLSGTAPGLVAETVRLDGMALRCARGFAARLLGLPLHGLPESPVQAGPGDILVLMDNYGSINSEEVAELHRQRRLGAKVVVLIYDLLPVLRPDWFPATAVPLLHRWLRESLAIADAALCISRSVAEELAAWLDDRARSGDCPIRRGKIDIGWFHLGSDFGSAVGGSREDAGRDAATEAASQAAAERQTMLMVGTVEPRKGHAQALAAFEQLWAEGEDIGLIIVGKPGWKTEALQARLQCHPEAGRRLHWLRQTGDADLARLYAQTAGTLVASEGEGFGLPLIEAARAGRPVLARDIPVFREIAGDHAMWFSGLDAASLAGALREWRQRMATRTLPSSSEMKLLDWDDSVREFLLPIQSGAWPMTWRSSI